MAFIDTPRTDAGSVNGLANGHNIEDISMEMSFQSPKKRQPDLVSQMRNGRGTSLRTASNRSALGNVPNFPAGRRSGEFTPLLKSATKRNAYKGKENVMLPQTPAFLKASYQGKDSSALAPPDTSVLYESDTSSFVGTYDGAAPLPQVASSSAQSTPLAVLPSRNGDRMLDDQRNLMTLREQENIIDKIEKENFGLKLKIHFLEDMLKRSDPNLNQSALKENTDLRVDKVTLQKDLAKIKKQLSGSERDAELLRKQLQEGKDRSERQQADEELRQEIIHLRKVIESRQAEADELRERLESEDKDREIEKLKDELEDLEAEVREKARVIDAKDDELDILDVKLRRAADLEKEIADTEDKDEQLQNLKQTIKDLEEELQSNKSKTQEVREDCKQAVREKERAVEDLEEASTTREFLRDQMNNKSLVSPGGTRETEQKAIKLEKDVSNLQSQNLDLRSCLDSKAKEAHELEYAVEDATKEAKRRERKLQDQIELLQHDHEGSRRDHELAIDELQTALKDLRGKADEKDLLQTRHDALTLESQGLQQDLAKHQAEISMLQQDLKREQHQSLRNERNLKEEANEDVNRLTNEIANLQRRLETEQSQGSARAESWRGKQKELELQKEKVEQRANGLQRTVDKLRESEGSLSGRELKLQEAFDSEKQRHSDEKALLSRQIEDLQTDLDKKCKVLEENRSELLRVREDLRISRRSQTAVEEKVQALEDEVDVLQSSLEEDAEKAKQELSAAEKSANSVEAQLDDAKRDILRLEAEISDARFKSDSAREDGKRKESIHEEMLSRINALEERLLTLKSEKQSLLDELNGANAKLVQLQHSENKEADDSLSDLRIALARSREKESEIIQQEATYKQIIRDLKKANVGLEDKIRTLEISRLGTKSPTPSGPGSAHKNELVESQRQLAEARHQIKNLREKARDLERDALNKAADAQKLFWQQSEEFDQIREQLEREVAELELKMAEIKAKNDGSEKTNSRLRARIRNLEQDLQAARVSHSTDQTIASERKDLHEMLKSAKLEAEDLQSRLVEYQTRADAASARERDLRSQLNHVRSERTINHQKVTALMDELEGLQSRYEEKVAEVAMAHQNFEKERRAMNSRVRFANTSMSDIQSDSRAVKRLEDEAKKKEKRHEAELNGLAKQVQWLRARCRREEGFRDGLAFEKRFLLMQVEMFQACNTADLRLLEQMGVTPDRRKPRKRSLKAVAITVVATVRMRKLQQDWAVQKKQQAVLIKKVEQMRAGRERRKSSGR